VHLLFFRLCLQLRWSKLVPFLGMVFRTPEKALSWSKLDELITNKQINFTDDCLLNERVMMDRSR
jgi:hypothetical protein